jgi:hypothetical protein
VLVAKLEPGKMTALNPTLLNTIVSTNIIAFRCKVVGRKEGEEMRG